MKRLAFYLFIIPLCLLSVLTVAYLFSKDEPLFSLKNIKIKGAAQLTDGEIMRRAYPFLKESIFQTQVDKVKEAVLAHPFVREVSIKRLYPVFSHDRGEGEGSIRTLGEPDRRCPGA